MSEPSRDLERPAADYVAGDLPPAERDAFERALEEDPTLAEEVAFWERMAPALRDHGRPEAHPPGPGMLAVVRRRAADEAERAAHEAPRRLPWSAFAGWAVAAVAVLGLSIVLLGQREDPRRGSLVAYAEDGSAVVLPASHVHGQATIDRIPVADLAADGIDQAADAERRPWLGLWTQPIELRGFERDRGLRVLRVAEGSPAFEAGMRPGDILLSFADCALGTRYCIRNAIEDGRLRPGQEVGLVYWRSATGTTVHRRITLGGCIEPTNAQSLK